MSPHRQQDYKGDADEQGDLLEPPIETPTTTYNAVETSQAAQGTPPQVAKMQESNTQEKDKERGNTMEMGICPKKSLLVQT